MSTCQDRCASASVYRSRSRPPSFVSICTDRRHAQPFLCRLAPQREMMMYPSPSSSPLPDASTRPFVGDAPPRAMSESLSFIKKLGVGLDRPLSPRRRLLAWADLEFAFARRVLPSFAVSPRPASESNIDRCSTLSSIYLTKPHELVRVLLFVPRRTTHEALHTLSHKSWRRKRLVFSVHHRPHHPSHLRPDVQRLRARHIRPTLRVIAGGRITNRLFAWRLNSNSSTLRRRRSRVFANLSLPRAPLLARFRFNESSNFNSSSSSGRTAPLARAPARASRLILPISTPPPRRRGGTSELVHVREREQTRMRAQITRRVSLRARWRTHDFADAREGAWACFPTTADGSCARRTWRSR